jgi:hypothetical protein
MVYITAHVKFLHCQLFIGHKENLGNQTRGLNIRLLVSIEVTQPAHLYRFLHFVDMSNIKYQNP